MNNSQDFIQKMHEDQGMRKIEKLKQKIDTTKYNIEVSKEIIAETPYDSQREKLIEKNVQRQHAIGSMNKEIRDTLQTMEKRSQEVST